jgi:Transposase DDE domain
VAAEAGSVEVLADSAYGSGQARADYTTAGHTTVIKPIPLRSALPAGFTLDHFTIDVQAGTATCPNQVTRPITARRTVTFGAACRDCPLRPRCTNRRSGRALVLSEFEPLLRAARRQAETPAFKAAYRQYRPMVERSIAWIVRGNRRLRYRGIAHNNAWLHHRSAAINLQRLLTLGLARRNGAWTLT